MRRGGRVGRFDMGQLRVLAPMHEALGLTAGAYILEYYMCEVIMSTYTHMSFGLTAGTIGIAGPDGSGGLAGGGGELSSPSPPSVRRTETQVALRFCMAKGLIPIPAVTNRLQAEEVAGALEWELDLDEVGALTEQALTMHVRRADFPWLRRL